MIKYLFLMSDYFVLKKSVAFYPTSINSNYNLKLYKISLDLINKLSREYGGKYIILCLNIADKKYYHKKFF